MTPDPAPAPRREISFWALASVVCAVGSACPIAAPATLLGIVFAIVALRETARKPHRTGRRLAIAGLVGCLLAATGWMIVARWWHLNVRVPLRDGPFPALIAGQAGDVAAFMAVFQDGGDEIEAARFLTSLTRQYGPLLEWSLREETPQQTGPRTPVPPQTQIDVRRPRVPYQLRFESGAADADALFVIAEPGQGFVLKFAWLVVRDPQGGDLVYPSSAAPLIDPPTQTGPQPVETPRG